MVPRNDSLRNPFKPTAGKMPPELIGRDGIVEEFRDGLENGPGAPERLMRITGMRGMGKTVMLNEFKRIALEEEPAWTVVCETANAGFCTRILDALSRKNLPGNVRIQPTAFGVSLGSLEIERASLDLRDAMMKATEKDKGLLITLDEVQDASLEEIKSLAISIQHVISEDRNIAFAFAGLPSMIDEVVNSSTLTFLRRAIPAALDTIPLNDVADSLADTMRGLGQMNISDELVSKLAQASAGYPFMVQLVGYQTWQTAFKRLGRKAGEITAPDVERGITEARSRFDATVIEPAIHHLPPMAIKYLLAMAEENEPTCSVSDIAQRMGSNISGISMVRARLIKEDLIETPARGKIRFAVPYLAQYLTTNRERIEQSLL